MVEEILASDLSVTSWCAGRGIGKTAAYRALNWFRENEPSVFGAGEAVARESGGKGQWFERARRASRLGGGRPLATGAAGSFAIVDAASLYEAPFFGARAGSITVEARGVTVTLPAGAAASDVAVAVSATLAALGVVA